MEKVCHLSNKWLWISLRCWPNWEEITALWPQWEIKLYINPMLLNSALHHHQKILLTQILIHKIKALILLQCGSLTRQIVSCLVAVSLWLQITDLTLFHIHQVLEGGHLLPQHGGNPRTDRATSDKLSVGTAKTNISAEWCNLTGHRLQKSLKGLLLRQCHLSQTPSTHKAGIHFLSWS